MQLSIVEAVTKGLPAPLRVGMTPEALVTLLGSTDAVVARSRRDREPAILKYGDLEFHFEDQGLIRLFADEFAVPVGAEQLVVSPGWIARNLVLGDAESRLTALGLTYRLEVDRNNEGCVDLVTECSRMKFRVQPTEDDRAGLVCFAIDR